MEKSDTYINEKGQLCVPNLVNGEYEQYIINSIRDDGWLGIYFSFQ
jgi:hypothetical protein